MSYFGFRGESGSAVFDNDGCIIGLVFGAQMPQQAYTEASWVYVTPIEDVFRDIIKFSGGQITNVRVAGC